MSDVTRVLSAIESGDPRAAEQLLKVGNDSPEYHLFAGKYHLNRQEYEPAIGQFEAAAKANPRLPFVHFNLGLAYLGKQDYSKSRDEFLKDIAVEPDLALNYEQLGDVYWQMQDDSEAEKNYREALRRAPRLTSSRLGLARIFQRQQKYSAPDGAVRTHRLSGGSAPNTRSKRPSTSCTMFAQSAPSAWKLTSEPLFAIVSMFLHYVDKGLSQLMQYWGVGF